MAAAADLRPRRMAAEEEDDGSGGSEAHSSPRPSPPVRAAAVSALHLYDADGFVLLATLCAFPHHEATEGLAVHPSGRVALAVGRAGALAMVNLVRGRRSFACRHERSASAVAYAEDRDGGDRFIMAAEEKVAVHDSVDCGKKVLALAPAKGMSSRLERRHQQFDTCSPKVLGAP